MPRESERHIKVTRTIYHEPSDYHETFTFEGDPETVRDTLYELGLFKRPKPVSTPTPTVVDQSAHGWASNLLVSTPPPPSNGSRARWRQIADFIESRGAPQYVHTQADIEMHFVKKRLSYARDHLEYSHWYNPSLKARRWLGGKLGGRFERSPGPNEERTYTFRFVKKS